jgi:hypothetical protein
MTSRKRMTLALGSLVALAVMLTLSPNADAKRPKRLRDEIATLKSQVAQLQSQADYQLRLIAAAQGSTPIAGGLCSDPCTVDSDGDGKNDCEDVCPCDPNDVDSDGDGVPDCADPCPDDATDACIDPCRQDADGDGLNDCEDPCPFDPSPAIDSDGDGIPDCADPCPGDKQNQCGGTCQLDSDGDGINDCNDPCPFGDSEMRPCVLPPPMPGGGGVITGAIGFSRVR